MSSMTHQLLVCRVEMMQAEIASARWGADCNRRQEGRGRPASGPTDWRAIASEPCLRALHLLRRLDPDAAALLERSEMLGASSEPPS